MSTVKVAAIDLGATSGRVIAAEVGPDTLRMETVTRFPNGPVKRPSGLHWDLTGLIDASIAGLTQVSDIVSIGVDSWAVDYALFSGSRMVDEPFHYRDERCERGVQSVHSLVPFEELYRRNGLQFLPFNTLYQLATEAPERMNGVDRISLIPDVVTFRLSGADVTERTNASTTGLLGVNGNWDLELMSRLGRNHNRWAPLVDPGTEVGAITADIAATTGLSRGTRVVTVGSHDTASAVVGTPMLTDDCAYISCGTWGLVGLELEAPEISDAAREANFTNEGGVDGRTRFLHNVMGLWLLNECVSQWGADLPSLLAQAAALPAPERLVDPNDPTFSAPGNMPARIVQWCAEHDVPVDDEPAAIARLVVESLAQAFAEAVHTASSLARKPVSTIHLTGGGSLNALLCQRTADRAGLPVVAGPVEATAIGNVMVQARTAGIIGSLEEIRATIATTTDTIEYTPTTKG